MSKDQKLPTFWAAGIPSVSQHQPASVYKRFCENQLQIEMNLHWWPMEMILQTVYKKTTPRIMDIGIQVQITVLPGGLLLDN